MITTSINSEQSNLEKKRVCNTAKILAVLILSAMITACGSTPVSESRYASVQQQIKEAEKLKANEVAGGELYEAQKKLENARKADKDGKRKKALLLLDEAELHAQLAGMQAMNASAQKMLDEVNMGLRTLQDELRQQ